MACGRQVCYGFESAWRATHCVRPTRKMFMSHVCRRHAGAVFELPGPASDDSNLPYPALRQTISSAQLAPSAHMLEHYSPPGGELLPQLFCVRVATCSMTGMHAIAAAAGATEASAASKEARGWGKSDESDAAPLPEPDLVPMRLAPLQRLLLEASTLGSLLFEAEHAAEAAGYQLTIRES